MFFTVIPGVSDAQAQRAWQAALTTRDPFKHPGNGTMGPGQQDSLGRFAAAHLAPGMTTGTFKNNG